MHEAAWCNNLDILRLILKSVNKQDFLVIKNNHGDNALRDHRDVLNEEKERIQSISTNSYDTPHLNPKKIVSDLATVSTIGMFSQLNPSKSEDACLLTSRQASLLDGFIGFNK